MSGMMSLDAAPKLPRYCQRKLLANNTVAYYFAPPTWARRQGCHLRPEALGSDYAGAVERVEKVLLPAFESWRSRGLSDMMPASPEPGTFDWLVGIYQAHQKWGEIESTTQRQYKKSLALFANHELKDGSRVGSKQLSDFTKAFVDAVYRKLLVVTKVGKNGEVVVRERRRYANVAMASCRRAWFVGQRAQEKMVPASNPFSRMGLRSRAPGQPIRPTPTATWDELVAFRAAAKRLDYRSIATAALLSWEWLQREQHVFGSFDMSHYRPSERPNSVRIVHPKNGEEAWWPLLDETGAPLFPELMDELDEMKKTSLPGLVFRRDHAHRRSVTPIPWITPRKDLRYLRSVVKKIIAAADLRQELSFTSFRHGGFTEGADSDLTDAELRAAGRHRSSRQLPTYAKRTGKQLITATKKRREQRRRALLVGLNADHSSE
ncbi:hypothetical protein IVB15_09715 [Bradyrhizobium sp. 182]|uniref:hypothetical protein n=1 Tax=unclassified Bradyrhizobium TaxID=2631580 RepID=UPI001FF96E96|nr:MULTISPECIES: hypothetical protein [unclassified Bradyrhizobium]MCK1424298.1 hypothetical protein [Bradyrhizobium sp. CW12]MCK1528006.1 hypothetical protein [Bradyrhizobium sp. 182]MCK1647060.1 hypothetical protein [Bradyrhizobium sp. 154]